ncbi:MAG: TlpA family protein disulfide reductase, partial [Myxococcota bacterium]
MARRTVLNADRHEYPDLDALYDDYVERGWTDGLPVVPPSPEKVARFLASAGLEADEILGEVPTREVVVTAEHAAINAVMAGCRAEYMPVVVAAVRAHLHEKANCHSTTGTLSGAAQIVVVNGPVRRELDVQCEGACFGPGWRANATIGRALRLVIRNVCRAIPGFLDRASFSSPLRYSFCFGENEEASDWQPLHVERGFAASESTVTVHSTMTFMPCVDFTSRSPENVCES